MASAIGGYKPSPLAGPASAGGPASASAASAASAAYSFHSGGQASKPVPMKLFATWEVDRTPPNCIPR